MSSEEESKSEAQAEISEAATFAFAAPASSAETDPEVTEVTQGSPEEQPSQTEKSSNPDNSSKLQDESSKEESVVFENMTIPPQVNLGDKKEDGWPLLQKKISSWLENKNLETQLKGLVQPLYLIIALLLIFILSQIYGRSLHAISQIPLASGLCELAGLIWLIKFSITRLIRSEDRKELTSSIKKRWDSFFGEA